LVNTGASSVNASTSSSLKPMMALSGERFSWLMNERNGSWLRSARTAETSESKFHFGLS
jgi:hypothetical protein